MNARQRESILVIGKEFPFASIEGCDTRLIDNPDEAWAYLKGSPAESFALLTTSVLRKELEDRASAEAALNLNDARLNALLTLSQMRHQSEDELSHFVVNGCVQLTGSTLGYLHFVNEDENGFENYVFSKGAEEACVAREYMDPTLASAGIWADSLRLKAPVIHNDYPRDPERKGLPEGHIELLRVMSIPVQKAGKVVAILGVANKPSPYDEADLRQLLLFGNRLWSIIEGKRLDLALEKANAELQRLATIDSLTGLANRRTLEEYLSLAWKRGVEKGTTMAILMIDIDSFKNYNDTFGHVAGDKVLCAIARTIGSLSKKIECLCVRYGGDEFLVAIPFADDEGTLRISDELLHEVRSLKIPQPNAPAGTFVTISIGLAISRPELGENPEKLITRADDALYEAKRSGRDRRIQAPTAP
jgi:diguanylate cyclase (GGDEF)-like protein